MKQCGKTFVIAEAGVNHNGDMELAKELVGIAAESGADAVKFQTFTARTLATADAKKADYQVKTTSSGESQFEMLQKLELRPESHRPLVDCCEQLGIEFMSTPFDTESLAFLVRLGVQRLKLPSGEITNGPFLLAAARSGLPVILSTGMSFMGEIEFALGALAFGYLRQGSPSGSAELRDLLRSPEVQALLCEKVSLLHCTTEYPAPFEDVNLNVINTLRAAFGLETGFSDHSPGIAVPIASVAVGASIVEKHFTKDRNLPGPDHKASLEPTELRQMVEGIRAIEKAMGHSMKVPTPSEIKNRDIARKSLVARAPIPQGTSFSAENLTCKRPGSGTSPMLYWDYLGKKAEKSYQPDQLL